MDSQQISFEAKSVEIKKKLEDLNEEINTIFGGNTIDTIKTEEIKRKYRAWTKDTTHQKEITVTPHETQTVNRWMGE